MIWVVFVDFKEVLELLLSIHSFGFSVDNEIKLDLMCRNFEVLRDTILQLLQVLAGGERLNPVIRSRVSVNCVISFEGSWGFFSVWDVTEEVLRLVDFRLKRFVIFCNGVKHQSGPHLPESLVTWSRIHMQPKGDEGMCDFILIA